MANQCKSDSVQINDGVWYYESPGAIELVINRRWFEAATDHNGVIIKISRRKLAESIERMNKSRRKR
jgi:hypothetical protein